MKEEGFEIKFATEVSGSRYKGDDGEFHTTSPYTTDFFYDTEEECARTNSNRAAGLDGKGGLQGRVLPFIDLPSVASLLTDVIGLWSDPLIPQEKREEIQRRVRFLQQIARKYKEEVQHEEESAVVTIPSPIPD
jgi:hypothetical protein